MSSIFFNPITGQLPDAGAVSKGLSNMTGLPQHAIVHQIAEFSGESGGAHSSNQLSVDKLFRFMTQPKMMEFYRSMADEQVQAVIRESQMLAIVSPVTETHTRIIEVMFKELNLVGMDQVDALSPASIQTYNEFKKAVSIQPFKKQAKINVKTLIRQLAGYDLDKDNANEVEREVLSLVGQLYTEMVKNVMTAIRSSILPYGYIQKMTRSKLFVFVAEAVDRTFMAGQLTPELALAKLSAVAKTLNSPNVNIVVGAGNLEFWRANLNTGRAVDYLRGYYDPDSGIEYSAVRSEIVGSEEIISRATMRSGNVTMDLWEAPVPKVNSNDSGYDYMQVSRTVSGQFFMFPSSVDGLLITGPNAEKVNNTVDVFVIEGNTGKNVVYDYIEALMKTDTFDRGGQAPHPSIQETINGMNEDADLRDSYESSSSGKPSGGMSEGDTLSDKKEYREVPAGIFYNTATRQYEFASRLGQLTELTDKKLMQIASQLVAHCNTNANTDIANDIDIVSEYLQDSIQTEVTAEFALALSLANKVTDATTGDWITNDYGSLNLPANVSIPSTGLPPLYHNLAGMRTVARERNIVNSIWKNAGDRAAKALKALKKIADGYLAVADADKDESLQFLLEIIYVTETKVAYPESIYLRVSIPVGGGGADPANGYETVSSVLKTYVDGLGAGDNATYAGVITALNTLNYRAPEVEILRLITDGDERRLFAIALLDIATNTDNTDKRKLNATEVIANVNKAYMKMSREKTEATRTKNTLAITAYVNGDQFKMALLDQYDDANDGIEVSAKINLPKVVRNVYTLPTQVQTAEAYDADTIVAYQAQLLLATQGGLDPTNQDFVALPVELRDILQTINRDANRGVVPGDAVLNTNFIIAPLVSTKKLEEYANRAGANAYILPSYQGVASQIIKGPMAVPFKHNMRFAGSQFRNHYSRLGQRHGDAMDIDEDFSSNLGARYPGNAILGDANMSAVEDRLSVLIGSTAAMAERVMAIVLVGLPNTMATHQRLSRFGARLWNVILARPFETNILSLISVSALNGFATLVSPTEFANEHHSQVSTMVMTMAKEMGTNVIDGRRVGGLCGFTSHRVEGGYNRNFLTADDGMDLILADRPSVIAIAVPDTDEFAMGDYLHLFNRLPLKYQGDIRITNKCKHPGSRHLNARFPELSDIVKNAEDSASEVNVSVHVSPILSRGTTRHYNPLSGRYEIIRTGVSTKSHILLNSPGAENLMNGGIRTAVSTDADFATGRMGYH